MSETIAQRLEKERGDLSYRAFARKCGVSVVTMIAILRGNEPKDKTLKTIAEHLGCTAGYLRYGLGEAPTRSQSNGGKP